MTNLTLSYCHSTYRGEDKGRVGKILLAVFVLFFYACAYTYAQAPAADSDRNLFNHMQLGIGLGTEGAGLDMAMPIGSYVQFRLGMSYMPGISLSKHIDISSQMGGDNEGESRFEKVSAVLQDLTNVNVDEKMEMRATTKLWNGKVLVDILPFKKKNWFFSAGVYMGPRNIIHVENAPEDMAMLIAMSTFNNIYERVKNEDPVINYEGMAPELPDELNQRILNVGRMALPIGTFRETTDSHQAGEEYRMVPDENGMIRMDVKSWMLRPYLGFGYRTPISRDRRSFFSFDAGILCWGRLQVITHDGTDLIKDVDVQNELLKKYTNLAAHMSVYPAINIRLTRQIF